MLDLLQTEKTSICGMQTGRLGLAKLRLVMVAGVFLLGYLAIDLRLIDLTLMRTKPVEEMAADREDVRPLTKPLRGDILDRNGELIATSIKMSSLYADATLVANKEEVARDIAGILPDVAKADILQKLSSEKKFVWLKRNITPKQEYAINALGHPGLGFQEEDRRLYPQGVLAAHVAGYTDVDGRGIAGIEGAFDKKLAAGGNGVVLSVDLRVQHVLHHELSEAVKKFSAKAGIGMVMDVNTGEIIAMVSLPDFDPLHPAEASDNAKFNRASLGVFEMGSTFKIFPTALALDRGVAGFGTTYDATTPIKMGRFTISDYHAENRVLTVPEIFILSSNIGVARMAMDIGTPAMKEFYGRLGFFTQEPIELPERGSPLYPKPWREVSTLTASYGHGVAVSPVHLMRAAAAMVNGGVLRKPTLLKLEGAAVDGEEEERVIKPETSRKIRRLMELTVATGTGGNAHVMGYNVGGKTGTAEKSSGGRYDKGAVFSSFLGVFPVQNPQYAVLAILDEPKATSDTHGYATGGWTAAPVVAKVVERMAPLYGMEPAADTGPEVVKEMAAYIKDEKEGL